MSSKVNGVRVCMIEGGEVVSDCVEVFGVGFWLGDVFSPSACCEVKVVQESVLC